QPPPAAEAVDLPPPARAEERTRRPPTASTRGKGYPDTVVGDRRPVPDDTAARSHAGNKDTPDRAEGGEVGGLQRFEQRLENLISGVFARAFRSAVQPVEIAAALQRECDNNAQILSRERRMVPNDFHVELSQVDLDRLAPDDTAAARQPAHPGHAHAHKHAHA